jgi:hypothetical protein
LLVSRDIYNERAAIRRKQLGGLTPIEALLKVLDEDDEWLSEVKIDENTHRVTHLFFTLSHSIGLMQSFPDVLEMDCTYKTNKFKMPLLHILGVTPIETNFSAGFCFLPGESASDYLWALQSFKFATGNIAPRVIITDGEDGLKNSCREVFPDVPQRLCLWHINQNVLAKAKTTWRENALGLTPEEQNQRREARDTFMERWNKVTIIY